MWSAQKPQTLEVDYQKQYQDTKKSKAALKQMFGRSRSGSGAAASGQKVLVDPHLQAEMAKQQFLTINQLRIPVAANNKEAEQAYYSGRSTRIKDAAQLSTGKRQQGHGQRRNSVRAGKAGAAGLVASAS